MSEKKELIVSCDVCDARKMNEESLSGYERVVINADIILVDERSRNIFNRFPMVCNVDEMVDAEGDVTIISMNGSYEIDGDTQYKGKTVICVNGSLSVSAGTEKILENVLKICVNGCARYPKSMAPFLDKMTVNGKARCIPDDCIDLKSEFAIDKYFPLRARQDGKYYVDHKVTLTDTDVDAEALAAKNIQFVTERLLVREEYIPKIIGMFAENVEMDVIPAGFAYIGEDAELNDALIRRYGKCLYIDGDLILKDDSGNCFDKVEKIRVNGDVRLLKRLEEKFARVDAVYEKLVYIKGRYVPNQARMVVDEALLMNSPDGVEIGNCAVLKVEKDVKPELILEKLTIGNCGRIDCSPEQKSALQLVCGNIARISDGENETEEGEDEEGEKAVKKVVNADTYIL